ncbi:MAG: hypothetical protein ACK4SA_12350, partial [Caldilinea sp.]
SRATTATIIGSFIQTGSGVRCPASTRCGSRSRTTPTAIIAAAASQMVHVRDRIEPNVAAHEQYRFFVDQYIATYGRVQDLIQETTRHIARQ